MYRLICVASRWTVIDINFISVARNYEHKRVIFIFIFTGVIISDCTFVAYCAFIKTRAFEIAMQSVCFPSQLWKQKISFHNL